MDRSHSGLRVLLLAPLLLFGATLAQSAQFSIEAVKAAYLFRFASYVEWPGAARAGERFVIGIAGAEDVAVHLQRLTSGMAVDGRPVAVRRVSRLADIDGLHIFYVGSEVFSRTRLLRSRAAALPILLVTDHEHGLEGGGVINFLELDRNLKFEISLNAADRSGLKINSALLSVAARVERRPTGAVVCLDGVSRNQRPAGCSVRLASNPVRRSKH
jgi:hypothetical protein